MVVGGLHRQDAKTSKHGIAESWVMRKADVSVAFRFAALHFAFFPRSRKVLFIYLFLLNTDLRSVQRRVYIVWTTRMLRIQNTALLGGFSMPLWLDASHTDLQKQLSPLCVVLRPGSDMKGKSASFLPAATPTSCGLKVSCKIQKNICSYSADRTLMISTRTYLIS